MKTEPYVPPAPLGRRWMGTIVLSLLLVGLGVLLEVGKPLERLVEDRPLPMSQTLAGLQATIAGNILQARDVSFEVMRNNLVVIGPKGERLPAVPMAADKLGAHSAMLLLILLCAVPMVWRTWRLGLWRNLAVLATVIVAPLMLPVTRGVLWGFILGGWSRSGGPLDIDTLVIVDSSSIFITMVAIITLWVLIRKLLAEEPVETPVAHEPWMGCRPPILWAAVLFCLITSIISIWSLPLMLSQHPGGLEVASRIVSMLAILAATAMLVMFVQRWERKFARWAMPALALCVAGGLGNYVPGMLLLLVVLMYFDERTAGYCGEPLDGAAAERLRRRARKPLSMPVIMLAGLSIVATIYQAQLYFTDKTTAYVPALATMLVSVIPGLLAALLGWRESRALQTAHPVWAYVPFTAAALGAICFVVAFVAWVFSWGHQPLLGSANDTPVAWPATVKVGDNYHLDSFPLDVNGFSARPRGPEENRRVGEGILDANLLTQLGLVSQQAQALRKERVGNWYILNHYGDRRPGRQNAFKLAVYYYGLLPSDSTGRLEPPVCAIDPANITGATLGTNAKDVDPRWRALPAVREAVPNAEGDVVMLNYYVYIVNGVPRLSPWHARQAVRNLNRPLQYLCVINISTSAKLANLPNADLGVREFFAVMLPTIVEMLPK